MAHELMNGGEFSWPGTLGDWNWIQCLFFLAQSTATPAF